MERLPLSPDELHAEEDAAAAALHQAAHSQHARHHREWVQQAQEVLRHTAVAVQQQGTAAQLKPAGAPGALPAAHAAELQESAARAAEDEAEEEREHEFRMALAQVPSWQAQLTSRGLVVGLVLGALFCVVTHKLNLGPGIIPSLNIAAGLLAFCCLKAWSILGAHMGWRLPAFGAQECNAVQTFVTACSGVAFTGGFGTFLTALDHKSYELLGPDSVGNRLEDVYEPAMSRIIPYLLCTSLIGVFMLVGLRKVFIIDWNLTFPSGTATGLMVESFFTTSGAKTAGRQLQYLARWFGVALVWDSLKWVYSGVDCAFCTPDVICGGMDAFPLFGWAPAKWTWYLAAQPNIVGAGMICPHVVNVSMLLGAALTWGFLWPFISSKEGTWYPAGQTEHSFAGLFGYKVFITIALLLGDGSYNLCKVVGTSAMAFWKLQAAASHHQLAATIRGCSVYGGTAGSCGDLPLHEHPPEHAEERDQAELEEEDAETEERRALLPRATAGPSATRTNHHGSANGHHLGHPQQRGAGIQQQQQQPAAWFPDDSAFAAAADLHHGKGPTAAAGKISPGAASPVTGRQGSLEAPLLLGGGRVTSSGGLDRLQVARQGDESEGEVKREEAGGGLRRRHRREAGMDGEGRAAAQAEDEGSVASPESELGHRLRVHVFVTDTIPWWVSTLGFATLGVLGVLIIPHCYHAIKWWHVAIGYLVAPVVSLPVAFGCGLTDWDVSSTTAKLAIFMFAAMVGLQSGGVVVGLGMAGILMSATSTCATLMQDFKTGMICKCQPKAMFLMQLGGGLAGALLAPLTFQLFWATGKVGEPNGPYPNPYASIFRAMAIFGTQGMSVLPKHCMALMIVFFVAALVVNLARDLLPKRYAQWLPIPMAMAIPLVLGAYIAIDMAMGSLIMCVWELRDKASAELLAPAVASGLIVADGLFSIPVSVMGMLGISPPLCTAVGRA